MPALSLLIPPATSDNEPSAAYRMFRYPPIIVCLTGRDWGRGFGRMLEPRYIFGAKKLDQ